jgi:4-diphosphocytidyl-2-C-methyl-D-erythritol kinase
VSTTVKRASASAKINLALVVGARRLDGYHEVATVLQRIDLADRIEVERADELRVSGFAGDTLVRRALELLAAETGAQWRARIEKHIPVAAGLGGGSSDAATALVLANGTLSQPLPPGQLHSLAAQVGSDVPFFLTDGPRVATGTGTDLEPVDLPQDFWIVLVLPREVQKRSTAHVYGAFDGGTGFRERRDALFVALDRVRQSTDLAALPSNDLATSSLSDDLLAVGAFRADVSGAGPAVYGLFVREGDATTAAHSLRSRGRVWITAPAWYG